MTNIFANVAKRYKVLEVVYQGILYPAKVSVFIPDFIFTVNHAVVRFGSASDCSRGPSTKR